MRPDRQGGLVIPLNNKPSLTVGLLPLSRAWSLGLNLKLELETCDLKLILPKHFPILITKATCFRVCRLSSGFSGVVIMSAASPTLLALY
jgi:hypothetical protein